MAPSLPALAVTVCGEGQGQALNRVSLMTLRLWALWTGRAQPGTPTPTDPRSLTSGPWKDRLSRACRAEVRPRATVRARVRVLISGALGSRRRQVLSLRFRRPACPPSAALYTPWPRVPGHLAQTPTLCGQLARGPVISTHGSLSLRAGPPGPTPCRCLALSLLPSLSRLPPPAGPAVSGSGRSDARESRAGEECGGGGVQLGPGLSGL